jgi:hypothetical protein
MRSASVLQVTPRRDLPDRVPILGESHLRTVLAAYRAHYNTARLHQGIAQCIPDGENDGNHLTVADLDRDRIYRKPVLGGLTPRRLAGHQPDPIFGLDKS